MHSSKIEKMISDLNNHLFSEFNIEKSTVNIKIDKICKKLLYLCKKNYAYIENEDIKSRGLDYIKTSTLPYAAKLQKELLDLVLFKNQKSFHDIFLKMKNDFYNTKFDNSNIESITLKQRVTKNPDKYTTSNTPALIAKWMIQNNYNFYPGMFIPVICTGVVDGKMYGVHPDSNQWQDKIDMDYIWNNQILPKLSRITEVISPQFDWQQFDTYIFDQRIKKINQYEKWLLDSKKNEHIVDKITNDVVLSQIQKDELIKLANQNRASSLW